MRMGSEVKYIMNNGLAFDEERTMKRLRNMAEEGWILSDMSMFRYKLVKGEPQKLIYSMDYKELKKDGEEYFEYFKAGGWEHMCSYGPFHFFAAEPGTVPIYTDRESHLEKYKSPNKTYLRALIICIVSLLIIWCAESIISKGMSDGLIKQALQMILQIAGIMFVGAAVPCLMVTTAYFFRKHRVPLKKD
ncbi:MAG: DUF2812 domain-containing protein [Bacillota bacterium]|nr:DUF2812 domain-containing protein [Bacillota bacterium]